MLTEFRNPLSGEAGPVPAWVADQGLWISQVHGRYTSAVARRGNVFHAANSAPQALSVNSTMATGIIITNPPESGKIIAILDVCVALASLPAGQSALILTGSDTGAVTHTTPLTVRNSYINGDGRAAKALVDSAATVPTPSIRRVLGGGPAATVATGTSFPPFIRDEIAGAICLAPGASIGLQALTTAITVVGSLVWEEIDL